VSLVEDRELGQLKTFGVHAIRRKPFFDEILNLLKLT